MARKREYKELTMELSYTDSVLRRELPPEIFQIAGARNKVPVNKMTDEQIRTIKKFTGADIKKVYDYVRTTGKRKDWKYELLAYTSISKANGERVRLHIHLVIKGCPAVTIADSIKTYWVKQLKRATKKPERIPIYDIAGFTGYLEAQQLYQPKLTRLNWHGLEATTKDPESLELLV